MADTFVSDGKAVDVTVVAAVTKGDVVLAEGFAGIAMTSAASGEDVALEIALREHEITVPSGVTADKGDTLYLTPAGVIDDTDNSGANRPFMKVTSEKDANDVVQGVLLPQS